MNSIKIFIAAVTFVAAVSFTQAAQERKGQGPMSAEARIEGIEKVVGKLSAEQKSKITSIVSEGMANAREKGKNASKEDRREKMMSMMKEQRAQIREVLTPEQQKKFDAMGEGRGGEGRGRGEGKARGEGKRKKDQ